MKVILLTLLVVIFVIASDQSLTAAEGQRMFYLTKTFHIGSEALQACAKGYHMASFWEILDVSNFRYDTIHGRVGEDTGFGPPIGGVGWIRTGNQASSGDNIIGSGNCFTWASDLSGDFGTAAYLHWYDASSNLNPSWNPITLTCDVDNGVWCVED